MAIEPIRKRELAMRIDIGGGVRLFVDVEGPGLVPDGPLMREKPTLICMHGGPGFDHSAFKRAFPAWPTLPKSSITTTAVMAVATNARRPNGRWTPGPTMWCA
ncbi:hypothetical protein ACVBEH_00865 [Roseateles sp. GG27B]